MDKTFEFIFKESFFMVDFTMQPSVATTGVFQSLLVWASHMTKDTGALRAGSSVGIRAFSGGMTFCVDGLVNSLAVFLFGLCVSSHETQLE